MAKRELAERLLEELPDDRELTEEDMAMITALLTDRGAVGLSYSTQNGTLYNVSIGGAPVRTIADLRQVVATLPPPKPATGFAEAIAEAIIQAVRPVQDELAATKRELIITRVRLMALVEMLEERGTIAGADYMRRWFANYERDALPLWDMMTGDESDEAAARYREEHANWLAEHDARQRERLGADIDADLAREWEAVMARVRAADEKRRSKVDAPPSN